MIPCRPGDYERARDPAFVDACKTAARALGAKGERVHTEGYRSRCLPITPKPEQLLAGS